MQSLEARRRLVERLEREAGEAPGRYRMKLALLAALGYAVLAMALACTLGLLVFLVGYLLVVRPSMNPFQVLVLMMLALSGAVVLRALWIRFVVPEGHHLRTDEAPELRAEVERVRKAVGAAPLHGIVINAELNAAAAYVPHGLGLWRQRHYLILGLPLLHALDRRELAAVVAHEFGHFHGGHGHFSAWIYRLRGSWHRLLDGMSGGLAGGQLLWFFFRWYAPYFEAYSQVLARRQEYAADVVSARVAGVEAVAAALVRIELASDWLDKEFWPQANESARVQAWAPTAVHEQLVRGLARERVRDFRIPARLLTRSPHPDDTHPTLSERLSALQVDPPRLEPPRRDVTGGAPAASLLGELDAALLQRFSEEWRAGVEDEWKVRHQEAQRQRRRLAELQAHAVRTHAETLELACLSEDFQPGIDALPLFRDAVSALPANGTGHYRLGALLLKRGDESGGVRHLGRAMALDPALAEPGLRALDDHARSQHTTPAFDQAVQALRDRHSAPGGESTDPDDALQPHALEAMQLRDLARVLRGHPRVRTAWVALRPPGGTGVLPHYLVLLDWTGSVSSERAALPLIAAHLPLPGSFTLLGTSADPGRSRAVRTVSGEPAYRRA